MYTYNITRTLRDIYRKITLRRSSVSVAIRPLLGNPRRTWFLSEGVLSTLPFTEVTGDATEQQETVNFTGIGLAEEGVLEKCESEGHCRKIVRTTDISLLSKIFQCVFGERKSKRRRYQVRCGGYARTFIYVQLRILVYSFLFFLKTLVYSYYWYIYIYIFW